MRKVIISLSLFLIVLSGYRELRGVGTQIITQSASAGFDVGIKKNLSLTSQELMLSPEVSAIEGIAEPYVWALAKGPQEQIFIGTGDPGSVYRLGTDGKLQLLFRSPELHVHTLAVSPKNEIYAGTSPQGRIYRISPQGEAELFYNLPVNYIWKLVLDGAGNLYAATGPEGVIYKMSIKEGSPPTAEVFFDSTETHILDLVLDKESNLYAGSEPNGLIYRITLQGQAFVLYDAEEGEVHCLAVDSLGQLYAGTASGAKPRVPVAPLPTVSPMPKAPTTAEQAPTPVIGPTVLQEHPPHPLSERPKPKEAEKPYIPTHAPKYSNYVYKISPDGSVKKVLEASQALIFGLAVDQHDDLMVGTGSEARIYKIDSKGETCTLLSVEEAQVLCLLYADKTGFYYGTGNPGRVLLVADTYCKEGFFESEVFDTKFNASWGNISWEADTPEGTQVSLYTRAGNSKEPDNTWSAWSDECIQGSKIQSPSSRFIQYRVKLVTTRLDSTPLLQRVFLAHLPQNQQPVIHSLSVSQKIAATEEPSRTTRSGVSGRETKSISWKTTDPNGDSLRYQLFYKGRQERDWKPLAKEEIKGEYFYWQTTRVPDGEYLIKLVTSDDPDNPAEIALSEEKTSEPFLIDNSRPLLLNLKAVVTDGRRIGVSGLARDELSNIARLEYSVDAGDWRAIFPIDKIFDSREELFLFTLEGLPTGEHTIVINATDSQDNIGSGKLVVELL